MEKSFFINNVVLALLFIGNITIEDYNYYFLLIYLFLSVYHIYVLYLLFDSSYNSSKLKIMIFLFISILLYLFTYFIICDTNPFFYILVYYIFFPNFLKAILIVLFHTYIMSKFLDEKKEYNTNQLQNNDVNENIPLKDKIKFTDQNNTSKKYYFLCDYIRFFSKNKVTFSIFLVSLFVIISIDIYVFSKRIKIWVYLNDKKQTLPLATSKNTKYYITAMIANTEKIINSYIIEMKKLIHYLGKENVIVSIVENGDSKDNTREYLEQFQKYLKKNDIINRFYLEHEIEDPRENDIIFEQNLQYYYRIKYFSKLRNRCFELLYDLPDIDFYNTKVIFFNDIIFEYENIINLLATNNEDYDAVCGLDFYDCFYDSWVSIDLSAYSLKHDFPFFVNKEGQDLLINHKPIRVFSCWNGVIAFSAAPLKDKNLQFRYELDEEKESNYTLYSDQSYNFESECTYFHIDLFSLGYTKKFINPDVRVAYLYEYYDIKKYGYLNITDIKNYFIFYFNSLFEKRNKDMSNYKDKNIKLNKVLENWYLENKKK